MEYSKKMMGMENVDYVMVVNKSFEIIYNSRFDPKMESSSSNKQYKNLFEMYPSLGKDNSTIVKAMSTGKSIFMDAQEFADIYGRVYVTQNYTIPIFFQGKISGAVELTRDLTTLGDAENKVERIKNFVRESSLIKDNISREDINFDDILTIENALESEKEKAKIFAGNSNPILIYGETGTGKELFAQAIINYVAKPKQKIVIQNCAAIPENLMESILFGATRGSYTGAENKKGLFEEADGGIFFLDELNSLPFSIQGKLLRVIQDGTFTPIGSTKEKKVNVKIIAAMNIDPMDAIESKVLRKDLFYRLSGNMIYIPPLRERKKDIEYLTENYIKLYNEQYSKSVKGISKELRAFFMEYGWEGNVRELKHILDAMVSMTTKDELSFNELPIYVSSKHNGDKNTENHSIKTDTDSIIINPNENEYDLRQTIEKTEKELITRVLKKTKGNKTKAGTILGIPRQTLKYKMTRLGIDDIE